MMVVHIRTVNRIWSFQHSRTL